MRSAPVLGVLALTLAWTTSASAQPGSDLRFVIQDSAEVRAGPSGNFYVTNLLRRNDPVEVLGEVEGGWLKVRPPEGSHSWINTHFLQPILPRQANHVVTQEDVEVPVFIGSTLVNKRPTVVGVKLKRGSQVISIGQPQADSEGSWMPIDPPPGEVRYLRTEVVSRVTPGAGSTAVVANASGTAGAAPASHAGSTAPSANPPPTPEVLWQQAQQAERQGRLDDAIRLYALAGANSARTNPPLSRDALQRAHFLQSGHLSYGTVGPAQASSGIQASSFTPTGQAATAVATARLAPPVNTVPASRANFTSPSLHATASPDPARGGYWQTYAGRLRRSGRSYEDRPTYVLETRTIPLVYVTPQAGVDLEPYLERNVELSGSTVYAPRMRSNLMVVSRVQPLP